MRCTSRISRVTCRDVWYWFLFFFYPYLISGYVPSPSFSYQYQPIPTYSVVEIKQMMVCLYICSAGCKDNDKCNNLKVFQHSGQNKEGLQHKFGKKHQFIIKVNFFNLKKSCIFQYFLWYWYFPIITLMPYVLNMWDWCAVCNFPIFSCSESRKQSDPVWPDGTIALTDNLSMSTQLCVPLIASSLQR